MAKQFFTDIDLQGNGIGNLATPVAATDAATKGYVDSIADQDISKFSQTFGDGTTHTFNFAHTLNTADVLVQVRNVSTGALVEADLVVVDATHVSATFKPAPATNSLRIVVIG